MSPNKIFQFNVKLNVVRIGLNIEERIRFQFSNWTDVCKKCLFKIFLNQNISSKSFWRKLTLSTLKPCATSTNRTISTNKHQNGNKMLKWSLLPVSMLVSNYNHKSTTYRLKNLKSEQYCECKTNRCVCKTNRWVIQLQLCGLLSPTP